MSFDTLADQPTRYGPVTRALHWGMALLFAAQFASAATHFFLPRENELRQTLWSYHTDLGVTLFVLILLRGVWGLMNLSKRPPLHGGLIGRAALAGHTLLYVLMVAVPASRILAAAGGTRGLSWFGLPVIPARETEIAWLDSLSEWHGEMGWLLAFTIIGHIAMALVWHTAMKRDGTLRRMVGK